jgi:hypothetical protein
LVRVKRASRVEASGAARLGTGSVFVRAGTLDITAGAIAADNSGFGKSGRISLRADNAVTISQDAIMQTVACGTGQATCRSSSRFVIFDRSLIEANAVADNGSRVDIRAGQFVQSAGSPLTATSERGVSGEIAIIGPPLRLNGSLVVLASDLRAATALMREGRAARSGSPRSSLAVAGRDGRRQGAVVEASLPALYTAHHPARDGEEGSRAWAPPARTSVALSSRCE